MLTPQHQLAPSTRGGRHSSIMKQASGEPEPTGVKKAQEAPSRKPTKESPGRIRPGLYLERELAATSTSACYCQASTRRPGPARREYTPSVVSAVRANWT